MGATLVGTVTGLTSALANTAVGHIVIAPGTYFLSGELSVTRSVVIEAMVAASVVLNGGNAIRVLNVNPGSSGVVQLIGLNITGGKSPGAYCEYNCVCHARCGDGGGVYVSSGTVSITSSSITGNTASAGYGSNGWVHAAENFPSPRWENALLTCSFRFSLL
jgi:hypothetical protein